MGGLNTGMCCSGLEALKFFEEMRKRIKDLTPEEELKYERALSRFRYEVAKGYGVPKRINKAVKAWHSDTYSCGKCGASAGSSAADYCPVCGTRYLKNSYTEGLLKEQAPDYEQWQSYVKDVNGKDDVDERRHKEDEIIRAYRDGAVSSEREPADGRPAADDRESDSDTEIP